MTPKQLLVAGCSLLAVRGWRLGAGRLRAFGASAGWGLTATLVLASACAPAPQTGNTPKAGSAMSRTIVDPYLKIQAALANDSVDGIRQNAGEVATAATALGAPAMKIDTTAVQLAATTELADARQKFGMLSEAIDTYMTGLHLTPPAGIKVAVCPMVNKPWMQEGNAIANPYYGSEMLTCGNFR
jgi:HPt (histidine-containing phosphotransfer) domain-containing protein